MTKNQPKNRLSSIDAPIGRIMPNALELEDAVIGALLAEPSSFSKIDNVISPDDFYNQSNAIIFKAMRNLVSKRAPIDMLTVTEELNSMGELKNIGGAYRISELSSKVAGASHIGYHARIIKDKSMARKLIEITSKAQSSAYDSSEDISDTMEQLEKDYTELVSDTSNEESINLSEAISESLKQAENTQSLRNKGVHVAIPTNLSSLNDIFAGGWRAPDLIVVGGRPSMGKTQHALAFAKAAAIAGKHVLFASIEMTATQLVNRFLLEDERISGYNLRTGQMSPEEWGAIDEMSGKLWNLPIHIAGGSSIRNLSNIKSEARRLKRTGQLDLLIIDYLTLIKTNIAFQSRYLEVGYITGELKNLAKELNIPVILLSQLSRPQKGVEIREPRLEDLRESGDIEQDADIVLFIHRPDYYEPDAIDSNGVPWKNRGKIIISKYREGARNNSVIFYNDSQYKKIGDNPFPVSYSPF